MRLIGFTLSMFLSGLAALIYEMVWLRRLGDVLGQDVYAVTVVLTVFFFGLGLGGRLFGGLGDRLNGRIALYIALEAVIAVSALLFDPALTASERLYTRWTPSELSWQSALAAKGAVAFLLLVIPTIAMGGTITALTRHVVRHHQTIASRFAWFYGLNTLGAACGVMSATFLLIPSLGVADTMRIAVVFNVAAALIAWASSIDRHKSKSLPVQDAVPPSDAPKPPSRIPMVVAFTTGFVSVGLEILWTRGLSVRFLSGIYSFAVILFVYLLCIAAGSLLVVALDRRGWVTPATCAWSLILSGLTALASVALIAETPRTAKLLAGLDSATFGTIVSWELARALAVMGVTLLVIGINLPIVVRLATAQVATVGASSGAVYLVNSIGGVVAPLIVGFVLLPSFGLAQSVAVLAIATVVVGLIVVLPWASGGRALRRAAWIVAPLSVAGVLVAESVDLRAWKSHPQAKLVAYREGIAAAVSVVDDPLRGRIMQVNFGYTLGATRGAFPQRRQGLWPFVLRPSAKSALFLGIGTGGSVGAACQMPQVAVDALEIIPDVFPMLGYFDDINYGLTRNAARRTDIRLLNVDARHYVQSTARRYDAVVGDLFEPWRRGVGSLYTVEHFRSVKRLLSESGQFWQWLPLYQLSESELKTIIATFCRVFDHAQLWWLGFNAQLPAVALVGSPSPITVDTAAVRSLLSNAQAHGVLDDSGFLDVGPVLGSWICSHPQISAYADGALLNTLDRPVVEFRAPRTLTDRTMSFVFDNLDRMFALARQAESSVDRLVSDPHDQAVAIRFRHAVRFLILAHKSELLGDANATLDNIVAALTQTPDWPFPIARLIQQMELAIQQRAWSRFDGVVATLRRTDDLVYFAEYWSARRALATNDLEAAKRHLQKALNLRPDDPLCLELQTAIGL